MTVTFSLGMDKSGRSEAEEAVLVDDTAGLGSRCPVGVVGLPSPPPPADLGDFRVRNGEMLVEDLCDLLLKLDIPLPHSQKRKINNEN